MTPFVNNDNNSDVMSMLLDQDEQTRYRSWAEDEDTPELEYGKTCHGGETLSTNKQITAQEEDNVGEKIPVKEEKTVDAEGWEVAGGRGKGGKEPIPIAQLVAEWDVLWAGCPKLPSGSAKDTSSYTAKPAAGKAESAASSEAVGEDVPTAPSEPASCDKPTPSNKPASPSKADYTTKDLCCTQNIFDWAATVAEEEEQKLVGNRDEEEKSPKKEISLPIQDKQEQSASNTDAVESGEKAKKKRKRGKKGGKKINKNKLADWAVDEPAKPLAFNAGAKKEPENLPAAASPVDVDIAKQSEDLPATDSSAETDLAEVLLETTASADGQQDDASVAVASDIDVSGPASDADDNTGIITESSASVVPIECDSADGPISELNNSPAPIFQTLFKQEAAEKSPVINTIPIPLPTPPSTEGSSSSTSSPTPTQEKTSAQELEENKDTQTNAFDVELDGDNVSSTEAVVPSDDSTPADADAEDLSNEAKADMSSPTTKPKNKKRGKKGGKKAQKKAAKAASGAQSMTAVVTDKIKVLIQGYEVQVVGLMVGLLVLCAMYLQVRMKA